MYIEDLNKDNIELVKEYYFNYIEENKESNYVSNLMDFETFIQNELTKCDRCGEIILRNNSYVGNKTIEYTYLCECCDDDLNSVPYEEDAFDKYIENKLENE